MEYIDYSLMLLKVSQTTCHQVSCIIYVSSCNFACDFEVHEEITGSIKFIWTDILTKHETRCLCHMLQYYDYYIPPPLPPSLPPKHHYFYCWDHQHFSTPIFFTYTSNLNTREYSHSWWTQTSIDISASSLPERRCRENTMLVPCNSSTPITLLFLLLYL